LHLHCQHYFELRGSPGGKGIAFRMMAPAVEARAGRVRETRIIFVPNAG
jgi:hypothetical protein